MTPMPRQVHLPFSELRVGDLLCETDGWLWPFGVRADCVEKRNGTVTVMWKGNGGRQCANTWPQVQLVRALRPAKEQT